MYKLVVIDIDDTLIDDYGKIAPNTKLAIKKVVEMGVLVTLATGRMFISANKYASELDLSLPIITYQGALIKDSKSDQVLFNENIPMDIVEKLTNYSRMKNIHIQAYSGDQLYVKHDNEKAHTYSKMHGVNFIVDPDFTSFSLDSVTKMVIYEDPDVIGKVFLELQDLYGGSCFITKSKPYFLEILNKNVNKGHAIQFLCKRLGINPSEVIGIGDSWNDLDMFDSVGLSVAVDNAVDELKQKADYITKSNNDEGVREVLEKFILNINK